jgi:hypothetical protein
MMKKIFRDIYNKKDKGIYIEYFIYCISLGIYGLHYDSFVSWWGKGLGYWQIKIIAIIFILLGSFFGYALWNDIFKKVVNKTILQEILKLLLKVIMLWIVLLIIFILKVNKYINIYPELFLIAMILYILYLKNATIKCNKMINTTNKSNKKNMFV